MSQINVFNVVIAGTVGRVTENRSPSTVYLFHPLSSACLCAAGDAVCGWAIAAVAANTTHASKDSCFFMVRSPREVRYVQHQSPNLSIRLFSYTESSAG